VAQVSAAFAKGICRKTANFPKGARFGFRGGEMDGPAAAAVEFATEHAKTPKDSAQDAPRTAWSETLQPR
jgi:hypothetical protein